MAEKNIVILSGDTSTHKLTLSDGGITIAETNDTITWTIRDDNPVVESFKIKRKKDSPGIFSTPPPTRYGRSLKKKIFRKFRVITHYEYSIYWKDGDGNHYEFDPKISVMPSAFNYQKLILIIVGILSGLFTLGFLLRKRKGK